MQKDYGGVIWTNHALLRMEERKVKQGDAWATWKNPSNSKYDPKKGAWVYRRVYGNEEIEVVAKKNEKNQWLIISVWSNILHTNKAFEPKRSLLQSFLKFLFNM